MRDDLLSIQYASILQLPAGLYGPVLWLISYPLNGLDLEWNFPGG